MARTRGVALWGWWLAAAVSATLGSYAPTPVVQLVVIATWLVIVFVRRRHVWSMRPFGLAFATATFFVGVRLFYTALFGGTSPIRVEGTVLWALPQLWLPGPFSSIHIFGAVTAEMLLAAATDALRFVVVFIAFGAASSLVDPRRMLARVPKQLSGVGMTLSIALNLFNSLSLTTRSLNSARILRNEPSRWRMLLPLFEHTLERAQLTALTMLSRGWQHRDAWTAQREVEAERGTQTSSGDQHASAAASGRRAPVVDIRALTVAYGEREVLHDVHFAVEPGTLTVITGPTGSGKSTLLAQIRGAIEPGVAQSTGDVRVYGEPASLKLNVGLTTQRAERSFIAATVQEEIQFAADEETALQIATQLGLEGLLSRRTEQLSAGEAALVSVAAACASQPRLVLLDEPIADLDEQAATRVVNALLRLRATGTAIVIAEHRPEQLTGHADQVFELISGRLRTAPPRPASEPAPRVAAGALASEDSILASPPGTITAVTGANGSGKTTLLQSIAIRGKRPNTDVALVSHQVDDYFFLSSLAEEFGHNDRLHRLQFGTTEGVARRLVPMLPSLTTHPRDCSAGTRVALAIALQLSLCRPILLLDEPTRGLDAAARTELAGMLRETAAHQIAVVFATHDRDFVREVADAILEMPIIGEPDAQVSARPLIKRGVVARAR